MDTSKEILFLGAKGSGKTLLIRKIKSKVLKVSRSDDNRTIKTVGVNIDSFHLNNENLVKLREVGSSMISRWTSYSDDCHMIVIVIDCSDASSFPSAYILLLEIISHLNSSESKIRKPLVIALNKLDLAENSSIIQFKNIIQLDKLITLHNYTIDLYYGSSISSPMNTNLIDDLVKRIESLN